MFPHSCRVPSAVPPQMGCSTPNEGLSVAVTHFPEELFSVHTHRYCPRELTGACRSSPSLDVQVHMAPVCLPVVSAGNAQFATMARPAQVQGFSDVLSQMDEVIPQDDLFPEHNIKSPLFTHQLTIHQLTIHQPIAQPSTHHFSTTSQPPSRHGTVFHLGRVQIPQRGSEPCDHALGAACGHARVAASQRMV